MANLNGNAYTQLSSVGLFGAGQTSAGTGNTAGGFESVMPDVLQFAYTASSASPAVFTVVSSTGLVGVEGTGIVQAYSLGTFEGTPVSLGWTAGPFAYTATSASPAVFTIDGYNDQDISQLAQIGAGVVLVGPTPGGFTASTYPFQPYNSPQASITQYYMVATVSGANGTFSLATSQAGAAINSTSAIAPPGSEQSVMYIYGGVPGGFSAFVEYYIYNVSSNTFNLVPTQTSTSAVNSTSVGGGILQLHNANQRPQQIAYGTGSGTTYQGVRKNGFRVGIQDNQVIPSGSSTSPSSVSLDENPQTQWQNVPGSTCQATYVSALFAGGTYSGGWGASGGYLSGATVYEEKAPHVDDNGKPETTSARKARLGNELDGLKVKSAPTQAEKDRMAVVESALKELK